jgi:hypothetical protein
LPFITKKKDAGAKYGVSFIWALFGDLAKKFSLLGWKGHAQRQPDQYRLVKSGGAKNAE